MSKYHLTVYGRKQLCASCVGAPGSKDTYEWLQAALGRKYNHNEAFSYEYVDMDENQTEDRHRKMIKRIEEEDLYYPLVVLNDEIVAEGVPNLKTIYKAIEAVK